jgi:hypothetical protein
MALLRLSELSESWEIDRMEQQVENVAGLDVHRDSVVACARLGRGERPR